MLDAREGAVALDPGEQRFVHDQLRSLVLSTDFPCVGARSALRQSQYHFHLYPELGSRESALAMARDLRAFIAERPTWDGRFATFIASFRAPVPADEVTFERLLWLQLQQLHRIDVRRHEWDSRVSADPADPHFSFSFGGEAFFIVGLHAASSRFARRFAWPTLCFNPHDQFELIRQEGHFPKMRSVVRGRDAALQGVINPMLRDYGEASEAAQYSGRETEPGWRCPLTPEDA